MGIIVKRTLSTRVKAIADHRRLPVVTVETIIKDYIKSLIESAERGERVVIDGLTSITIYRDIETGEYTPRGRVSPTLKARLQHLNRVNNEN